MKRRERVRHTRDWVDVVVRLLEFFLRHILPVLLVFMGGRQAADTAFKRGVREGRKPISRLVERLKPHQESAVGAVVSPLFGVPDVDEEPIHCDPLPRLADPTPTPADPTTKPIDRDWHQISEFDRHNPAPPLPPMKEGCTR